MAKKTSNKSQIDNIIGGVIFEARERKKETQEEFGKRFKVGYLTVSAWESEKTKAPTEVVATCLKYIAEPEEIICAHCEGAGFVTKYKFHFRSKKS